jgi:hypothetical protein
VNLTLSSVDNFLPHVSQGEIVDGTKRGVHPQLSVLFSSASKIIDTGNVGKKKKAWGSSPQLSVLFSSASKIIDTGNVGKNYFYRHFWRTLSGLVLEYSSLNLLDTVPY